jgi:hypothetical protein
MVIEFEACGLEARIRTHQIAGAMGLFSLAIFGSAGVSVHQKTYFSEHQTDRLRTFSLR